MPATAAPALAPQVPARFALADLKGELRGIERRRLLRDLLLVLPLIAFLFLVFVGPICMFVFARSIWHRARNLPRTVVAIARSPPAAAGSGVRALAADLGAFPPAAPRPCSAAISTPTAKVSAA
jgi:hypothetical protein